MLKISNIKREKIFYNFSSHLLLIFTKNCHSIMRFRLHFQFFCRQTRFCLTSLPQKQKPRADNVGAGYVTSAKKVRKVLESS